jgi:LemA protein
MEWFFGLLAIVVVIGLWLMSAYNGFIAWRNKVDEAFSTMDVYLVKRYDLIPNLVETVKGYAKHESETLERVISARNKAVNATNVEDKAKAEGEFAGVLGRLFRTCGSLSGFKSKPTILRLAGTVKSIGRRHCQCPQIL